jgi:hypothetical protein
MVPDLCPTTVKILTHLISRYHLPLIQKIPPVLLLLWQPGYVYAFLRTSLQKMRELYFLVRRTVLWIPNVAEHGLRSSLADFFIK